MNTLYYGDNLDILRRYVKDESVDLIYLDPPFNSNQDYNVLFAERDGTRSAAQFKAFGDTWRWDQSAARAYTEVVERGGKVSEVLQAFRKFLGDNDLLAYLAMMAPRLIEMRRVLKPTGSIYLHCDPTASHYLKMLMDAVFGPINFRNEITWKRTSGRKGITQFGRVHDILLFYTMRSKATWNPPSIPYVQGGVKGHDLMKDAESRIFRVSDLSGAGPGSARNFPERTISPPKGRHWMYDQHGIDRLFAEGRIIFSEKGLPRLKTYLEDLPGIAVHDVWADIEPINAAAQERLGYPTQKPEALLERVINASSNEGDVVLDPFCGCGTAVAVAERLNRKWIGIDITHLAITLIRHRLKDTFKEKLRPFEVVGEPVTLPDAQELAKNDPYQFQWWALGLVGARPVDQKKGADKGIDGRLYFHDEPKTTKQIIFSVKAGGTSVAHVRDLRGVIEREKAQMGVLISMERPTQAMRSEAVSADFYRAPWGKDFPRLQLLTVEELLAGKTVEFPHENVTFKKAPRARDAKSSNKEFTF